MKRVLKFLFMVFFVTLAIGVYTVQSDKLIDKHFNIGLQISGS